MALQDDVQAILDRGVDAGDIVGATAQVVTGDGLLAAAAAGKRSADAAARAGPMTLDTVCWIASMTKAVTGTAANGTFNNQTSIKDIYRPGAALEFDGSSGP